MKAFRIALTGDFLGVDGQPAYGDNGLSAFRQQPFIEYHFLKDQAPPPGDRDYWQRFYSLEVRAEHLCDVEGLIVLRPWVKRAALAGADRLVAIGRSGAGYDKLDLEACTDHEIVVFNAPHSLDHATASTALLFMLALSKRLPEQERIARAGRWDLQAATLGNELSGRTLGIIGLGNSGRELARLVNPFDMRVLAFSPHADPAQAVTLGIELTTLDKLLAAADFVSLHARLSPEKRKLIGRHELAQMKSTAFLINVARGELIDQPALVAALSRRAIAGAALDVFETEPLPPDDPLLQLDNVIATPHWSCSTQDVWRATGLAMVRGMIAVATGQLPENIINPAVLDRAGFQKKLARFQVNRSQEPFGGR